MRTEADGTVTVLAETLDGRRFHSPNDLAVHADGSVWFTDPTYGLHGEEELPVRGVYRWDPDSGTVAERLGGFAQPNGIAFSPDGRRLWVSDSAPIGVVRGFDLEGTDILHLAVAIPVRSDGMATDQHGNLYTTCRDGVRVFSPDGTALLRIPVPEEPSNCCFGGAAGSTLFITARTSVYAVEMRVRGRAR